MSQASEIVNAALRLLNLYSDVLPVVPEHQSLAFDAFKDMLNAWEENEVNLPLDIPNDIDDQLDEDEWITKGLKYNLAVEAAPYLQVDPSQTVISIASDCYDTIVVKAVDSADVIYPNTLPLGQGNRRGPKSRVFFSEE